MKSSTDAFRPVSFGAAPARRIGPAWLPDLRKPAGDDAPDPAELAALRAEVRTLAAGRAAGEDRVSRAVELLAAAAAQLHAIAHEFAHDRERSLHALAVAIARTIVQRELKTEPELVGELVRDAVARLPLDATLEIRLHPDDLALFEGGGPALLPEGRALEVRWVPDASIDRGGFVIETPQRLVDGRTDVALRALYERLEHE